MNRTKQANTQKKMKEKAQEIHAGKEIHTLELTGIPQNTKLETIIYK